MNNSLASDFESGNYYFFSINDPIRTIYAVVDSSVLLFGLSLNLLLIYLIRSKTVASMKMYKNLLMMSCAMDVCVAFWTFIVQPMPCVDHGYRTIILNGVFRNSSQAIRYAAYLIWIQFSLFFLITTMSQYVYRFCILCRNGAMPSTIFWSLMFAQVFLNLSHGAVLVWADYPRPEDAPKMAELREQIENEAGLTEIRFTSFIKAADYRWLTHNFIMCAIIPIFYGVIYVCFTRIRRAIEEMNVLKVREYNKQVSRALLFQALLPTFEICAWCIQMTLPLFVTMESTVLMVIFTDIPIHLVSVLNPLGTIFLVAPYRRAVFRYLRFIKSSTHASVAQILIKGNRVQQIGNIGTDGAINYYSSSEEVNRRKTANGRLTMATRDGNRQSSDFGMAPVEGLAHIEEKHISGQMPAFF